jgi:hypothetical protein
MSRAPRLTGGELIAVLTKLGFGVVRRLFKVVDDRREMSSATPDNNPFR